MRYIKTYEMGNINVTLDSNKPPKKYFIDDMGETAGIYYLFRVDGIDEYNILSIHKLYTYIIKSKEVISSKEDEEYYDIHIENFNIIFDSDSFEEVNDYFMMLADANKYNL